MRIYADANPTRWFLVIALLASQFGCASMPTRTEPAQVTAEWVDGVAEPGKVDEGKLKGLIAELKGKIEYYHHGDPEFAALSERVEKLDSLRGDRETRKLSSQNKGMLYGAAILPLSTLCIIAAMDLRSGGGEGDPVGVGLLYYIWFLGLVPQALVGALAGGWIAGGTTGAYVTDEFRNEVGDIIKTYNALVETNRGKRENPGN